MQEFLHRVNTRAGDPHEYTTKLINCSRVLEQYKIPYHTIQYISLTLLRGGGVHPDYFVKLDFEIAVDQQTKARDRTFEGVPDYG